MSAALCAAAYGTSSGPLRVNSRCLMSPRDVRTAPVSRDRDQGASRPLSDVSCWDLQTCKGWKPEGPRRCRASCRRQAQSERGRGQRLGARQPGPRGHAEGMHLNLAGAAKPPCITLRDRSCASLPSPASRAKPRPALPILQSSASHPAAQPRSCPEADSLWRRLTWRGRIGPCASRR